MNAQPPLGSFVGQDDQYNMSADGIACFRLGYRYMVNAQLRANGTRVEFSVVEIFGKLNNGAMLYGNSEQHTEQISDAPKFMDGSVKFDGCMSFELEPGQDCATHICGLKKWLIFARLGEAIFYIARKLIGNAWTDAPL